jgi:hypothetical protein
MDLMDHFSCNNLDASFLSSLLSPSGNRPHPQESLLTSAATGWAAGVGYARDF